MEVGCIGIGKMGSRMARRILGAGHKLAIYDVSAEACASLVAAGATMHANPAAVARQSEVVLSSVPGPEQVDEVMTGPDGVLSGAKPGTIVMETSTIGPAQSKRLDKAFATAGIHYIDAPVSGGVRLAETGELTAMIGGDKAHMERARPVLSAIATRIHHLGPIGSGNVAKAINQMIFLTYVATYCEAARLGREAGLDVPTLVDLLGTSVAGQPLMTGWESHIVSGDTKPGFAVYRVIKDLNFGDEICEELGFDAPIFQQALGAFREMAAQGHKDKDMASLYIQPK